jgi:RNA polymerase sigma-70 factor (ECF subfamily)
MDRSIVVRAQHGDRAAFSAIVEAAGDRLHAVAQGILRDFSLAEDVTQAALLQVWRDLPKLRDPDRFEAWAYRVVIRAAHAESRRAKRWMPGLGDGHAELIVADGTNLVADRDQLERAFRQLTIEQRTVVALRYLVGQSVEQIAETLEIPFHTVRSRLYHAMRALRAAIEADERVSPPTTVGEEGVR